MNRVDATNRNMLTQVMGGLSLAALLLYGGMALEGTTLGETTVAVTVAVTLFGTMGAVWSLAHLGESRGAAWMSFVLVGVAPVAAFLGWLLFGSVQGLVGILLWIALIAGAINLILTAWVGVSGPTRADTRAYRTAH